VLVALYQDKTFTSQSERGSTVVVGVAATSIRGAALERRRPSLGWALFSGGL
jgi:hypothetical protein